MGAFSQWNRMQYHVNAFGATERHPSHLEVKALTPEETLLMVESCLSRAVLQQPTNYQIILFS